MAELRATGGQRDRGEQQRRGEHGSGAKKAARGIAHFRSPKLPGSV